MAMLPALSASGGAFLLSTVLTAAVIRLAGKLQIYDGNNHLKVHVERVSPLGGIGIFAACWVAVLVLWSEQLPKVYLSLLSGSLLLFLIGVKDDLVGIPALRRLLYQVVIAVALGWFGVRIGEWPVGGMAIPMWAGMALTVLLTVALINAYNFIDGVNGLAGGLSATSAMAFGWMFHQAGMEAEALAASGLAGSILGFLVFNFGRAKIFMGDNGSTFIGLMFSFFAIRLSSSGQLDASGRPSDFLLPVYPLLLPAGDMAKVVLWRIRRGFSPFRGDRTHIHHLMGNLGFGHRAISLSLYGWNLVVILVGFQLLAGLRPLVATGVLLLLTAFPYLVLSLLRRTQKAGGEVPLETSGSV